MKRVCPKCGFERKGNESVPIGQCPGCGAIYAKVEAALEREEVRQRELANEKRKVPNFIAIVIIACALFISWLFIEPNKTGEHSNESSNVNNNEVHVSRAEYGAKWPYTITSGTLDYESAVVAGYNKKYVTISYGGMTYAINGSANSSGKYQPLSSIWRDDPRYKGAKISDPGLIQKGLALCD